MSWWAHRAELDVLRRNAERSGGSVSSEVRGWWLDGLPVLVDPDVLLEDPGRWTVYVHHLPRFLPRARGTPRSAVGAMAVARWGVGLGDSFSGRVAATLFVEGVACCTVHAVKRVGCCNRCYRWFACLGSRVGFCLF